MTYNVRDLGSKQVTITHSLSHVNVDFDINEDGFFQKII